MKVDTEWVKKQYLLCNELIQILGTTSNKLKSKYMTAGTGWNDKNYAVLGGIVQECSASLLSAALEISQTLNGLEQMISAIEEYNTVHLSDGGGVQEAGGGAAGFSASGGTASFSDSRATVISAGRQWASQLSERQHDAIQGYTGSDYFDINACLRGRAAFTPENAQRATAIHQALSCAQIPCACTVYRGASSEALGQYQNMSDNALVGCVIRDAGFMSTSLQQDHAFSGAVQLEISVPAGAHGAYIGSVSVFPGEQEVLFDAHQQLEITGVRRGNHGERIISARMIV